MSNLKKTLFDLFNVYENVEDIINALRSLKTENKITNEDYDNILLNYNEWLNEWKSVKYQTCLSIQKMRKEVKYEIMNNVSYDINGTFDNSFEEESRLITDINILINGKSKRIKTIKKDILINIINHYLYQYSDTLQHKIYNKMYYYD